MTDPILPPTSTKTREIPFPGGSETPNPPMEGHPLGPGGEQSRDLAAQSGS